MKSKKVIRTENASISSPRCPTCWASKYAPRHPPRDYRTGRSCSLGYLGARKGKTCSPNKNKVKPGEKYPWKRPYPLKPEAPRGIQLLLSRFLKHGLIRPCQSPCSTPILPVQKPNGECPFVQDLRALMRALQLGKDKKLNIFTDSKYGFHVLHAHVAIWKERGMLTTRSSPVKHKDLILVC